MQHKNSKKALHADNAPSECLKQASNKVKEYYNFTKSWKDQDTSFQKLLKLELGYGYLAHCTLIWYALHLIFTSDI